MIGLNSSLSDTNFLAEEEANKLVPEIRLVLKCLSKDEHRAQFFSEITVGYCRFCGNAVPENLIMCRKCE